MSASGKRNSRERRKLAKRASKTARKAKYAAYAAAGDNSKRGRIRAKREGRDLRTERKQPSPPRLTDVPKEAGGFMTVHQVRNTTNLKKFLRSLV